MEAATANLSRREQRREARRREDRRRAIVSLVSTVVVLGTLAAVVVTSPGWESVKETFFSWSDFRNSFPDVLRGFWLDVKIFVVVEAVVLVTGLLIAVIRTSKGAAFFPFRAAAVVYVDVLRGVPVVLAVYLIGFGVPALGLTGLPTDVVVLGGIALGLCYSAYVAEVYRAGIESVSPNQRAAGLSLGLSEGQTLRYVVLPQAVRRVIPPLLNDFISLQKDVALISILGPLEAFREAQVYSAANFNYTPLIAAALLYLCVTIPLTRVFDHLQSRERKRHGTVVAGVR